MKIVATLLAVGAALAQADSTFFDDFTGSTLNTTAWELATWANGAPFGCTFTKSEAVVANGQLNLNLNGADKTCAEARTWKEFTYGKFATRMKPSAIQGADSSFFLYTGTAGTSTHYEIDIEYINAGKTLHTNVWVQGKPNELNLPSDGNWVTVGFEWTKDYVRWFSSDGIKETELRRVSTNVPAAMRLMMNHWNGDNAQDTKSWLGTYNGDNGVAQYDWVKVVDVVPQPQPSATTTTPQPSTTTTAPPTTTAAPTPAPSSTTKAPAGSAAKWGQCGGIGYQGAITCAEGTCKKLNDYYSQCQ